MTERTERSEGHEGMRKGEAAMTQTADGAPMLEIRDIAKTFGSVIALYGISTTVRAGEVTCVLGDNGAGKSTFIKMLSGVYQPDRGQLLMDGKPVTLSSPRAALDAGIATVYQDLAMVPLMAIWRNFFLGSEPTRGWGPWRRFDSDLARKVTRKEMADMGIDIRDPDQPVGTLSGGERQSVAIARAVHFGARLLILDEPTSALGVKQAGVVLKYIVQARDRGLGVIFITHNPHHAYPVGDRFLLLNRGRSLGDFAKADIPLTELTRLMAGGAELEQLAHELERGGGDTRQAGRELLEEIQ
jgi:simple sugar transport system ATP-binding protein